MLSIFSCGLQKVNCFFYQSMYTKNVHVECTDCVNCEAKMQKFNRDNSNIKKDETLKTVSVIIYSLCTSETRNATLAKLCKRDVVRRRVWRINNAVFLARNCSQREKKTLQVYAYNIRAKDKQIPTADARYQLIRLGITSQP